jgi:hypothetical protein
VLSRVLPKRRLLSKGGKPETRGEERRRGH